MSEQRLESQLSSTPEVGPSIKGVYDLVAKDFAAVNQLIPKQLTSDTQMVEEISQYITQSGGKRLRPLLVILSARCLGYSGNKHILLAAVIEFLHTATLLHDDVVDKSFLRRGKATVNSLWGNASSVLVGDFLYSRAFQMMVELKSMPIMQILSDATNVIAEGEVAQLSSIGDINLSEQAYFDVIRCKTAMLFKAASHSAAVLSSDNRAHIDALEAYGLSMGMAYQLVDDWLDYAGNQETMGKNVGDDLAEGKMTLPLIYAMQHAGDEHAQLIGNAIQEHSSSHIQQIMHIVQNCGALDYTKRQAEVHARQAVNHLAKLPANDHRDALRTLAEFAVARLG